MTSESIESLCRTIEGRLCADCGHSIWLHPEMAFEGTDGTCSGDDDCECEEFENEKRNKSR